jgi:hypothetical protein
MPNISSKDMAKQMTQQRPVTAKFDVIKKPLGFSGSRQIMSDNQSINNLFAPVKTTQNFFKTAQQLEPPQPQVDRFRTKSSGASHNRRIKDLVNKKGLWAYEKQSAASTNLQPKKKEMIIKKHIVKKVLSDHLSQDGNKPDLLSQEPP